jgi:hypothetical protein
MRSNFWAWLMVGLLIFGEFSPVSLARAESQENVSSTPALEATPATSVVINEVRAAVFGSNQEFIELYNTDKDNLDLSGWKLTSSSGTVTTFSAGTTLATNNWLSVNSVTALADSEDTLTLVTNTGLQIDQIRYGLSTNAQIGAANANLSLGRRADGASTWYTQLTATPGAANGGAVTLQTPSAPFVRATSGNSAHLINIASKKGVEVQTTVPANSRGSDQIVFDLIDSAGTLKFVTGNAMQGSGQVISPPIDTTTVPEMVDGSVTVRVFAKANDGLETAYVLGTTASRDTIAPAAGPSAFSVAATNAPNPAHAINLYSFGMVKTDITLPSSTEKTDVVTIELSDGKRLVSQEATALVGGGTFILQDRVGLAGLQTETLADGPIALRATLTDRAGNSAPSFTGTQATKDTAAPSGSVTINDGATVTNATAVELTITASDVGTGVTEMRLANTNDFAGTSFETFQTTKSWSLITGDGPRTVYLQIRDTAGNVSVTKNNQSHAESLIWSETDAGDITLTSLAVGTQTVRALPIEADISATSPTTLTTARYLSKPIGNLPTGTTAIGSFREIGVSDLSKISFPATIKIYYTAADLAAAGVTSESQLLGIAFYDLATERWQTYQTTGVITTDQTVDSQSFAGYLFATATHLTPMVALADVTPPLAPGSLTATPSDKTVELSWAAVSEATSYVIRYRIIGSSNDYTTVSLAASQLSVKITNLTNGTNYEFGVASRDNSGNLSSFRTANATPSAPELTAEPAKKPLAVLAPGINRQAVVSPQPTVSPTPEAAAEIAPQIGENQTERTRDFNRLLMILAILLIGAGALMAGFYGYQWWATAPATPTGDAPPKATVLETLRREEPTPPRAPSGPPVEEPTAPPESTDEPPSGRW